MTPKNGIGGQFSIILTEELAAYLKNNRVKDVHKHLGLSLSMINKFRKLMGIQNKFIYRDDEWLLAHQEEILFDSLDQLNQNTHD